ncbi:MAG: sigma-70 family RNA polymerase sigma factor, partial [Proteocatella sp.]
TNGKMPTDDEIAGHLGINIDQYWEKVSKSNFFGILSLELITEETGENRKSSKLPPTNAENSPENILINGEMERVLQNCLDVLREREKEVIIMYYHQNKNMREIAEALSVSEPRISQIHSNAIKKLRLEMKKFMV